MPRASWLALTLLLACGHHETPSPSGAPVAPTAPAPDDLSPQIEQVRAAEKLPAAAIAIWRHGTLIARGVAGSRRAGDAQHPVTFDDQWHLGSDTKAMTATLIGIFVDRGVLRWNDTIAELFAGETIDPGYAHVTLDQLLQHRGGAPGEQPIDLWVQLAKDGAAPTARASYVHGVLARPPAQAPGTYVYSNTSYMIAGAALERATRRPWEELIRRELFVPLHMDGCGFGAPGSATLVDQPWGHHPGGAPVPPGPEADNPPGLGPAGTVHCSLADWGTFLAFHAAPSATLVKPETFAHLHTPGTGPGLAYMGGWIIVPMGPGDTRYAHEGSNTMWHAVAIVIPALDEAIAVVANQQDDHLSAAIVPLVQSYLKP